jgi:putative ABC transport system permease protein
MVPVARRNLFAEKARLAISIGGVAFAVLLIVIVVALYRGFENAGQTFKRLPGDLWVVQQGTTDPFHSLSLLDSSQVASIRGTPGVAAVIPVLNRQMEFRAGDKLANARFMALDAAEFSSEFAELQPEYLPSLGRIVIDKTLSRKTGLDEGETATIGEQLFVVDHVRPADGESLQQFVFMNFDDAERVFGIHDVVNYAMVVVASDAAPSDIAVSISDRGQRLSVFTSDGFATSIRKEIDETFLPVIAILVGIGLLVGAAVVGLTIYTATIERSREFGVMRAVGGSSGYLYRIVLSQSAMLTTGGYLCGVLAAWVVAQLAAAAVPEFTTDFQLLDIAAVLAATALMAVVASFIPARRINGIDPAIVFKS